MNRFVLPLTIFAVMVGFLAVGLTLNPREIPSPLVGKAAPQFSLPQLHDQGTMFSPDEVKGQVWLLNFWASWCSGCKTEHPVLMQLAKSGEVPIYGMDYKDQKEEALAWLNRWGNPYPIVAVDAAGNLFIAERDNHVIRKVDMKSGVISTVAGTGTAGFSGDGGPAVKAQLRQPHSIVLDRDGTILICDIGNQRIRRLHLDTGTIETYAGTGEAKPTTDGAPVAGTGRSVQADARARS